MSDLGWRLDPPPGNGFDIGSTYVHRAVTTDGRFWGKFVITITDKEPCENEDVLYSFTLDTILDGSPGLVGGWDG